jgi:2-hydroxycyclohexanecarboxyl-CoA dehydrogenase
MLRRHGQGSQGEGTMARIAVVTGSASGIGRASAERLAAEGFDLALLDIDQEQVQATARAIGGVRAIACHVDITDHAALLSVRARILAELGSPAVVVNCAGWSVVQPFMANDAAFWRKAVEINLMGTIAVTRTFLDDLIADGSGRVISIASDAGRVGSTGETVYAAAKGGVIAFSKSLAREMARHGVTANCVCPGPTATKMLLVQDPKRIEALTRAIPMRRLAQPEDIAGAVAYFASPSAAYVTGQVLSVSGGLTMAG